MKMPKSLSEFWEVSSQHKNELAILRKVMLDCGLEETFKWAFPTYTYKGKNIISLTAFKDYYGIWFFQGVFLSDELKILKNAQEGKTKALRQWKFADSQIDLDLVKAYVLEAIENQIAGKELKVTRDPSYLMPSELNNFLIENQSANLAFYKLTPGKQKEYANYITDAKQESTKLRRLDKILPMISKGIGLNDKYK